jgi:hypothetical protein
MLLHTDTIQDFVSYYDPITLKQMDSVKLMDRTDTKFVFHHHLLIPLLEKLKADYFILDVNGARISRYETLYYDTDDFALFQKHQCKGLNRYKVRSRKYIESNISFFEVKFKNNKGRTKKERISTNQIEHILSHHPEITAFINSKTKLKPEELHPKFWVNYSRMTLVSKDLKERLTIDLNLTFKLGDKISDYGYVVIAELKQNKFASSPFTRAAREMSIRQASLSKYCLGTISLFPEIKHNNFKPVLLYLNRLQNEHR